MNDYAQSSHPHDLNGFSFPAQYRPEPSTKRDAAMDNGFGFDPSGNEKSLHDPFMIDSFASNAGNMDDWLDFAGDQSATPRPSEFVKPLQRSTLAQLQRQAGGVAPMHTMHYGALRNPGTQSLSSATSFVPQHGQVTPARSNSATSEPSKNGSDTLGKATEEPTTRRKRGKGQVKAPLTPPESTASTSKPKKTGGRKRKNVALSTTDVEEDKRRASLEKNRVAAAKCRINKKEKTEQLQRDSHTKAKDNAELRSLVASMENEVQTLTAYLSVHSNCADCRNPDQLKEALHIFQEHEMRKRFPGLSTAPFSAHSPVSTSSQSMPSDLYSQADTLNSPATLHPPLPDFNLSGDFDVHTPLPAG